MTDTPKYPPTLESLSPVRRSTAFRLMVLFLLFSVLLVFASLIGTSFSWIPGIGRKGELLIATASQNVIGFCATAFLTGMYCSSRPFHFAGLDSKVSFRPIIGVVIVFVLGMPAMNYLVHWNESLTFPSWASGMENSLRTLEEQNGKVVEEMLEGNSFVEMLIGVLIIGVLTGFSEEYLFRGTLQKIFSGSGCRSWIAVWGAAAIFSAIHFQFFGFFPRLLLGAFFGYLLVWSGSLWPGIFAHTFNNSVVVISYWASEDSIMKNIDRIGIDNSLTSGLSVVASVLAVTIFLSRFRNYFFKIQHHG